MTTQAPPAPEGAPRPSEPEQAAQPSERSSASEGAAARLPGAEAGTRAASGPAARAGKRRSPGSVKAAANLLVKEAERILKKHGARIAPEPARAIRESADALARHRNDKRWDLAEDEAERLDELLHLHASFARKSPLRETLENVAVAVLVALGLRSCLYEPFKIPSGSMMPTLLAGDHIFVNKFIYGIQIPFTTTVVGERWGHIERGDVIVFRYPIDETEDFIKRVIGLPGDTVRVDGNKVSIRRAGTDEFEVLPRTRLPDKCRDESGKFQVPHCELYEETLDNHTYVVRYKTNLDPRAGARRSGEWTVPEGHLLVMGDNRNESHDSLAWTREGEAVVADGLVSNKDLRDLTDEKLFFPSHPDDASVRGDTSFDHVLYIAEHASDVHGLQLEVWREPVLGGDAVWRALTAGQGEAKQLSFPALVESEERLTNKANARLRARLLREGSAVSALSIAGDDVAQDVVFRLDEADAVMRLRCGNAICRTPGRVAEKVAEIVERWNRDRSQDARQLLDGDGAARFTPHLVSRAATADVFVERSYSKTGAAPPSAAGLVRLRAWRQPTEGIGLVRDAALIAAGSSRETARQVMDDGDGVSTGDDAWLVESEDRFTYVRADPKHMIVFSLECGRQRCSKDTQALALAREVEARVPAVAQDRSRLPELLAPTDLPGLKELPPVARSDRYEYDKIRLDASIRDISYSLAVWAWLRPSEGLDEKLAALKAAVPNARPDDSVASGAVVGDAESGHGTQYVFAVPSTGLVVRIQCTAGLCPDASVARDIARRAYQKAQDPGNFIDPVAQRPQPYVPRGNVKGRAERIWLPPSRFWLPIR